eukprot:CAMPEP_0202341094 /NCGR_PEP_ID=MMETSP1126-20121109/2247_1 /ASSEMBLY_ACC=CAM_ASM_000457 /TAXON_ID=3047 /ORGANISM="Dunaliella tertiolecta, Strain CCMP1320" /LENGTH=575 /DNA_ID=CAMNT_0048931883 /DNA_START=228 /DNA_END=1952 /DNA_ORIENTATION=-
MKEGGFFGSCPAAFDSPLATTTEPGGKSGQKIDMDTAHVLQPLLQKPFETTQPWSGPNIKWVESPAFEREHSHAAPHKPKPPQKQLSMGSGQLQLMAQAVLTRRTPQHSMSGTQQHAQARSTPSRTSSCGALKSSDIAKAARLFSLDLAKHGPTEDHKSHSTGHNIQDAPAPHQHNARCISSDNACYAAANSNTPCRHPPPISARARMSRSISSPADGVPQPSVPSVPDSPAYAAADDPATEHLNAVAAELLRMTLAPSPTDAPTCSNTTLHPITTPPPAPPPTSTNVVALDTRALEGAPTLPAKRHSDSCTPLKLDGEHMSAPRVSFAREQHTHPYMQPPRFNLGKAHLQQLAKAALSRQVSLKQSTGGPHSSPVQSPRSLSKSASTRASSSGSTPKSSDISKFARQFSFNLSKHGPNEDQQPPSRGRKAQVPAPGQKSTRCASSDGASLARSAVTHLHHPPPISARARMSRSISSPPEGVPLPSSAPSSPASVAADNPATEHLDAVAAELLRMILAPSPADVPTCCATDFDPDATPPPTPPTTGKLKKIKHANPHPGTAAAHSSLKATDGPRW